VRDIVDKIHQMVLLRVDAEFSENERVILKQLFGDYKTSIEGKEISMVVSVEPKEE
jgi:hypothetical protein